MKVSGNRQSSIHQRKVNAGLSLSHFKMATKVTVSKFNRPFAAKPSRDLLFIKLWAATLRMPAMAKACRKHQNGQV